MLLPIVLAALVPAVSTDAPSPEPSATQTRSGSDEAVVWIESKKPRVKVETDAGFVFHLDFKTHGALSLADVSEILRTEPKGRTLSFDPVEGILSVAYDQKAGELQVLLRSAPAPACKMALPLDSVTTRILLRQRDQLALYAVPRDGGYVAPVWLGRVDYRIRFRHVAQYELCHEVKITMGERVVPLAKFREGIVMDALDEIADVAVSGLDPAGKPFSHRYTFDFDTIDHLLDHAYRKFLGATAAKTHADGEGSPSPAADDSDE